MLAHNIFDDGAYIEVSSSIYIISYKYIRSLGCW